MSYICARRGADLGGGGFFRGIQKARHVVVNGLLDGLSLLQSLDLLVPAPQRHTRHTRSHGKACSNNRDML